MPSAGSLCCGVYFIPARLGRGGQPFLRPASDRARRLAAARAAREKAFQTNNGVIEIIALRAELGQRLHQVHAKRV